MEMREYLRACVRAEEERQERKAKLMNTIMAPVIIAGFWTLIIGVWLIR